MDKGRLEAFSDGVIAIIITIMVLEFKVPHGNDLSNLIPLIPIFLTYTLSFVFLGIYWNNHHHLFSLVEHIDGKVLWANLHLLFWLTTIPFATSWLGQNPSSKWPVAIYGFVLLMNGVSYFILTISLVHQTDKNIKLSRAINTGFKEKVSVVVYFSAIGLAFLNTTFSLLLYILVTLIWIIPDPRIEKTIIKDENTILEN